MTDFRTATSIGERIQAARKDRGMRTAADLAAAIPGGMVKESTIQNVEAGRKLELTVSQLLNIALALRLPPAFLLAPIGNPDGALDLPHLSQDFSTMVVAEFEGWFSGNTNGAYFITSAAEHRDRNQLQALREFKAELRERTRLIQSLDLEKEMSSTVGGSPDGALESETVARLRETDRRLKKLSEYLESAGLDVGSVAH